MSGIAVEAVGIKIRPQSFYYSGIFVCPWIFSGRQEAFYFMLKNYGGMHLERMWK